MKKNFKTMIVFIVLGVLVIGYYYYLSNRELVPKSASSKDPAVVELNELIAKRIVTNYPQTPLEVVNLYLRINRAYYRTSLNANQIESLGSQAMILMDAELLNYNPKDEYIKRLTEDIKDYRKNNRYISEYQLESNSEVDYKSLGKRQYAMVDSVLFLREGNNLVPINQRYILRKDDNGNWKILGCKNNSLVVSE